MGDEKLREWAREHLPEVEEWAVIKAGASLVRRCAEICRKEREDSITAYIGNEFADAILREFGMEGK